MPNKINDLRNHLFDTLAALKDKNAPMDLDRARVVAEVAKVIVESAKVEVSFLKVTGALQSTDFLPTGEEEKMPAKLPAAGVPPRPVAVAAKGPTTTDLNKFDAAFDGGRDQSLIGERTSRSRGQ